jgi:site-specific DNA-methyltransferase (adenine-specific)
MPSGHGAAPANQEEFMIDTDSITKSAEADGSPRHSLYRGEKSRLYCGNCLKILSDLKEVDAVITDPPYSSGGFVRSDRQLAPSEKYTSSGQDKQYKDFFGDNLDGRSWTHWLTLVFSEAFRVMRDGGYFMSFADWRQMPLMTDIIQMAGFVWRGVVVWNKGLSARAPHCGYFRHQCEYIIWGTKGKISIENSGPFPGCINVTVKANEKFHMTAKPVEVMQSLCKPVREGETILDPFMGSGTTGVVAIRQNSRFIGIEMSEHYFKTARRRIEQEEGILRDGIAPQPALTL